MTDTAEQDHFEKRPKLGRHLAAVEALETAAARERQRQADMDRTDGREAEIGMVGMPGVNPYLTQESLYLPDLPAYQHLQNSALRQDAATDTKTDAIMAERYAVRRTQLAVNMCLHVEGQRGRSMLTDKGAQIARIINGLLDEIYAEDNPPVLRELDKDAFGGSAKVDLDAIGSLLKKP